GVSRPPPPRLGGGLGAPPPVGEFIAAGGEPLGDELSFAAAPCELLHADPVVAEGASVGLVEDLARVVSGGGRRREHLGVGGREVDAQAMMSHGGGRLIGACAVAPVRVAGGGE